VHLPKTKKCDIINIDIIFKIKYMTPRNVDNLAVGMPEELATTRNEGATIMEFKEEGKAKESKKDRKAREAREKQAKKAARDLARKRQSDATKSGGRIAEVRQEIGLPKTEIGESIEESAEPTIPFSDLYPTPEQDEQLRKIVEAKKNAPIPIPQRNVDVTIPPADAQLAAMATRVDSTPKPTGLWGKFKSLFTTTHDERVSAKFSQMRADSDKTPADFRAEAQGEAMMKKQDKKWFKEEMRKAEEEIEDERILAKEGPKWSEEAKRMMEKPAESPEMEAARIQSSAYSVRKTAEENAQIEHDSVKVDAKITDPKVLEKIRKRAEKGKADADKLVAGYEKEHNKKAGKVDEFKVEMRAAGQALKDQEALEEGQRLFGDAADEIQPGPYAEKGRVNMEKFSESMQKITDRIDDLLPIVKSIKLGWFTHLKVKEDKEDEKTYGLITNLPEGNENIVLDYLVKEKEKLGAKGKIEEANKLAGQMEAFEEYTQQLTDREKLRAKAEQV